MGVSQGLISSFKVHLDARHKTLTACDDLCMCPQEDMHQITYSHDCKDKRKIGSHCRMPLPAVVGTNYASGVDDEFFSFKASQYASGGMCKVMSTHRDTLIAVYGACSRTGAQQPKAFSNSEGHLAQVDFPCKAGEEFFLFWNAEYIPGRHTFTISERCQASCVREHRSRHRLLRVQRFSRHRHA